ncbi:MAG: GNAT family N-acetyltransferase [Steroidobacteraceae bacterium]
MKVGGTELELRACVPADVREITAIYAHAVLHGTASFELRAPDSEEMARRQQDLLSRGYPYFVAVSGHEILGYAYAGPYRTRPAYMHTLEDSVYVRPDAQRLGIGLALLQRLVQEAELRGFRQMVAVIGDSANRGSIRLHERVGFEHIGVLHSVGWKHGRWLDAVFMQRELGPGATTSPGNRDPH